jgi:hypothetical protein
MSEKMKIERYISGDDTFEIVDNVNSSYRVWNIGEYMSRPDLIPMCQMMENGYGKIRRDTLKAIRLPECEVKILCDAACFGICSLQEAREALNAGSPYGGLQIIRKDLARRSLPVFERIYEEY